MGGLFMLQLWGTRGMFSNWHAVHLNVARYTFARSGCLYVCRVRLIIVGFALFNSR